MLSSVGPQVEAPSRRMVTSAPRREPPLLWRHCRTLACPGPISLEAAPAEQLTQGHATIRSVTPKDNDSSHSGNGGSSGQSEWVVISHASEGLLAAGHHLGPRFQFWLGPSEGTGLVFPLDDRVTRFPTEAAAVQALDSQYPRRIHGSLEAVPLEEARRRSDDEERRSGVRWAVGGVDSAEVYLEEH